MEKLPVSTVLLTKNSARSLPAYFESMQEIDDIILLDGGSTDGTLELAKKQQNVRVFPQNPKYLDEEGRIIDFSSVRNEGYKLAHHRWILCVDSDEAATPKLLSEVGRVVQEGPPGVYYVRRTFYYDGKPVVTLKRSTSDHIRLFHLDRVRGCLKPIHERLDILPGTHRGTLDAEVSVPLAPLDAMRRKYNRFLEIEARANRGITFGRWFRWIFIRNLLAVARRPLVVLAARLIPVRGQRLPLGYEWEQLRYSWMLIWKTGPWRKS
jgi:glycosyltransferase involved in cell wall biosynthesis